jgi:hypothetical protein
MEERDRIPHSHGAAPRVQVTLGRVWRVGPRRNAQQPSSGERDTKQLPGPVFH